MQETRKPIPGAWWAGLGLVLGTLAVGPAWAIGFGASHPVATLGQPLDISIPLRLEPSEDVAPECVAAEVTVGETAVPPAGVGATLVIGADGPRAIRVRTLQRIDEPVLTVLVHAGCVQRLSRRYVVFADPPTVVAPPVVAESPAPAAAPTPAVARAEGPPLTTATPAASASAPPRRPRRAQVPPPVRRAEAPRPRLRLDAAPPIEPPPAPVSAVPVDDAMAAVDAANEAVKAAIAAASASQGRIAALEAEMQRVAAESAAQRELVDLLRARAQQAEGRNSLNLVLGAGLLLVAGIALWLWRRLRELERDRRHGWLQAARPPAPTPAPTPSKVPVLVERSARTATGLGSLGAGLAPVHRPTPSELPSTVAQDWSTEPMMQTQPLVPAVAPPPPPPAEPRDVSAEELIDLEQQAEFFVVLGQDEAAIDLLVAHLRDSGGASPLPYLKLLDIYRRRDDRAAYERTRDRFNHRFNAHAPPWEAPHGEGRSLEDYPAVMHWIEQVWPRPLDAMAELESLLFRKDGGELFELPAYRELLLLYSLARDLLDGGAGGAGSPVDVLLPLSDGPAFMPTSPRPYFGDETAPMPDGQPTAPIDLDLDAPSDFAPQRGR